MRKLKSLAAFNAEKANSALNNAELRNVHGGSHTSTSQSVSTDQGPDKDTDCGEKVTYDDGTVIIFKDKNTIQ